MKHRFIRKVCITFFAAMLLTGCGSRSKEALDNELAYRQIGINKLDEGDYEGAVEAFQKALDQSLAVVEDLEIDICYYKATAQFKNGDLEGAIETYDALIAYDKKNPDAYYLRGCLLLQQEDLKNGEKNFRKALELDSKNAGLYVNVYKNLKSAGLEAEAGEVLNEALKLSGDKAEDYREKGYVYYLLGNYDNARQNLDKAINMKDSQAILYLAQLNEAEGNTEQAQQLYEAYISNNEPDTGILNSLGCMQMQEGNYEKALTFFQTALATENPSNERELRRNEIAALEYLSDFGAAKEKAEAYLDDYPEDKEMNREYEFLSTRAGIAGGGKSTEEGEPSGEEETSED